MRPRCLGTDRLCPSLMGSGHATLRLAWEQVLLPSPASISTAQQDAACLPCSGSPLPLARAPRHPCTEGVPLPCCLAGLPPFSPLSPTPLGVWCSTVRTQPFGNGAFRESRATFTRKLCLSLFLQDGRLPSCLKTGGLCVHARGMPCSFSGQRTARYWAGGLSKAVQTRGFSRPPWDRHGVYHISAPRVFVFLED